MQERSDETLVREVQEGSISAFEDLVRRYQHKLYAFVLHIVRDHHTAQDTVQESFISLYKSIDRVDTKRKFSSYVFSIARNHAISLVRSRKFHMPLEEAASYEATESLEAHIEATDDKRRIHEALETIDKKYKKIISLYYFEDLSYEEMSKRMRMPLNTIRTHLRRAKKALQEALA